MNKKIDTVYIIVVIYFVFAGVVDFLSPAKNKKLI